MERKKFMKTQERIVLLFILLLLSPLGALAQQKMIKGQVVDERGEAVIGASVMIKGGKGGTITDIDGYFSIQGKIGNTLSVSYIGFAPLDVKVTKLEGNKLLLQEDTKLLDEVVVVGMDTQKRNTITAAVSTVSSAAINDRPITDLTSALQGNVAGFNFSTDAVAGGVGGEMGAEIKFNIRGVGSINGGAAYVLVDGVEQSMQNVNPADVESITVLKDASAAAVYGARAAYGVVLVTTKSGRQEKVQVSYSGKMGFSSPIGLPKMMNSLEFAEYYNQAKLNSNDLVNMISEGTIEKMHGFIQNPYSEQYPGVDRNVSGDKTTWASALASQYGNTDWIDYYFRDRAAHQSHSLNVRGGSANMNFYVGLGYTYQEGLMDKVQDDIKKYYLNTKFHVRANKWLQFDLNNNVTLQMINRPMANQTIFYNNATGVAPNSVPEVVIDGQRHLSSWNELRTLQASNYQQNRVSDALTFSTTITPLRGWDILAEMKVRLDVDNNNLVMKQPYNILPSGQLEKGTTQKQGYTYPGIPWQSVYFGSYTRGSGFNYYLSPNISTSYVRDWGAHSFRGRVGYQMELKEDSNEFMYKDGMLSDDVFSFDNANGKTLMGEARSHWATMGMYAKLNWNYKETYYLELSGRYDGSSRFASGNRWGFFPSFSAGYDIARADYFKALNLPVSQFKIRLSYGSLGNQNGAGLYDYLSAMPLSPLNQGAWLLPGNTDVPTQGTVATTPKMLSPFITWEKVESSNLGLDLMLFKNRLSVEANIYQRTTRDMIGPAESIPDIGGIDPANRAKVNNASLRNRGWELTVNWSDRLKCGFSYSVGFNMFNYKAEITKYNNPEGIIYNNHTGLARNKGYYVGMDIGEIWGYQADDLFMTNREIDEYLKHVNMSYLKPDNTWQRGDLKYIDSNGDHRIDSGKGTLDDHGDLKIIGNATPKYSFGFNLNVGYKGFEISALFQGVAKRDFPITASPYMFGGGYYFKEHMDHWSPENPNGYLPRLLYSTSNVVKDIGVNQGYNTTRYLLNAAYMRMKNLQVSYSLPKRLITQIGLNSLRVYFTCDNLFTVTKLPKQFDPETLNQVNTWAGGSNEVAPGLTSVLGNNGNGKVYPLNRNFVFGLDFSF